MLRFTTRKRFHNGRTIYDAGNTQALVRLTLTLVLFITTALAKAQLLPPGKVREDFQALLNRPSVPHNASFETFHSDSAWVEKGFFYSESSEKVPVLIYKPEGAGAKKLPVVICLHGTGGSKEGMKDMLYRFSKAGFMAISIDGRFHGERLTSTSPVSYAEAITAAWKNKGGTQTHPFFFDTVYDLWKLVDYLVTRPDVDTGRIGMMGVSKGGIETWMAASVDMRIKVAVPVIAAQSFEWSLQNDRWQGRARTIWGAHQIAAKDQGDTGVNKNNVKALWDKLVPGITSAYDCPSMIRLFAPRPLLLLNTENDLNCPLPGARLAFEEATKAYRSLNAIDKLAIDVAPNEPHRYTPKHMEMTLDWFKKWL